jgi:hypothetical protein
MVLRDGELARIELEQGAAGFVIAERVTSDGERVFLSEQKGVDIVSRVWRDGARDTALDAPFTVRAPATSDDGRWRAGPSGAGVTLYNGADSEVVWRLPRSNATTWDEVGEWITGIFRPGGAKGVATAVSITPQYVSNRGDLIFATCALKSGRNNRRMVVWQRNVGRRTLQDELESRGATVPAGWILAMINDVSADGRTIVGTAEKGPQSRAVVIRFGGNP